MSPLVKTFAAGNVPKFTPGAEPKPQPLTDTAVPPVPGPELGEIAVTTGACPTTVMG